MCHFASAASLRRLVEASLAVVLVPALGCAGWTGGGEAPGAASEAPRAAHAADDWPEASEELLYVYGALLGAQLAWLDLDPRELAVVQGGVRDAALEAPLRHDPDAHLAELNAFREARLVAVGRRERRAAQAFLEAAAREPGATRFESGLVLTEIEAGSGRPPEPEDRVQVRFESHLRDGTPFRASGDAPVSYPLATTTRCWQEALPRMRPGGRARLVCPPELAYGDRGVPPAVPGGAVIVFDVELVDVERAEPAADAD